MNPHTESPHPIDIVCEVVADLGRTYPWIIRLHVTSRIIEASTAARTEIIPVEAVVYTRAALERLGGEPLIPSSPHELEEMREQFGATFAAVGFTTPHAVIACPHHIVDVATSDDVPTGRMPFVPRVIAEPWERTRPLSNSLPLGCLIVYREIAGTPPQLSPEQALLARWLEIRAAAHVRWLVDGPVRRARPA